MNDIVVSQENPFGEPPEPTEECVAPSCHFPPSAHVAVTIGDWTAHMAPDFACHCFVHVKSTDPLLHPLYRQGAPAHPCWVDGGNPIAAAPRSREALREAARKALEARKTALSATSRAVAPEGPA